MAVVGRLNKSLMEHVNLHLFLLKQLMSTIKSTVHTPISVLVLEKQISFVQHFFLPRTKNNNLLLLLFLQHLSNSQQLHHPHKKYLLAVNSLEIIVRLNGSFPDILKSKSIIVIAHAPNCSYEDQLE